MNTTEADRLAKRIVNTWNGGPNLPEWIDALTDLEDGAAGTTFVRLRAKREHPPTIATFLAEYRTVHTAAPQPHVDRCPHDRCPGDGWQTVHYEHDGRPYRSVVPCTCPAGHTNEPVSSSVRNGRSW